ncbi:hypothetical protein RHGRI_021907 [Rhododendron griersonianum]|uniref:Galactose oxidase/kelch repeat superfamily protein n=1 Tax=Rhododendron griersonianum TaxID=479676 RepID=A0AAV6JN93_9ERIC|nr:hypothetical protein RHGRI_021907 [Rhododendron griersonianum]KAG5542198.1 hypothetical protein RHGRI_021907 [Rhododendron griersonianum]
MFSASSSPPPSRSHEKTAYVRAINLNDEEMEFYSVPINHDVSGGEDGSVRVLTPIKAPKVPLHGGFAAVDNKLYCIGGDPPSKYLYKPGAVYRPVRSLYTFDTSCRLPTKSSWKKRSSMHTDRVFPLTVVVYGKIFVFQGIDGPDPGPRPWAEVFDPKSGRWTSLSPPSQLPTGYGLFAVALPDLGKILVGSCEDEFFYIYYVGDGTWERRDHKMVYDIPCNVKPVAVETMLFWFNDCYLYAYDVMDKWSYSGCIKDLVKVVPLESLKPPNVGLFYPTLHHVADNVFSLLCLEYFSGTHQATLLHCVKFSISVQGGEDADLNPTVMSAKAYVIQTPMSILDAVVMSYLGVVDWVDISKLRMFQASLMYNVGEVGVNNTLDDGGSNDA